jgi:hypothetical protein
MSLLKYKSDQELLLEDRKRRLKITSSLASIGVSASLAHVTGGASLISLLYTVPMLTINLFKKYGTRKERKRRGLQKIPHRLGEYIIRGAIAGSVGVIGQGVDGLVADMHDGLLNGHIYDHQESTSTGSASMASMGASAMTAVSAVVAGYAALPTHLHEAFHDALQNAIIHLQPEHHVGAHVHSLLESLQTGHMATDHYSERVATALSGLVISELITSGMDTVSGLERDH